MYEYCFKNGIKSALIFLDNACLDSGDLVTETSNSMPGTPVISPGVVSPAQPQAITQRPPLVFIDGSRTLLSFSSIVLLLGNRLH